MGYLGYVREQLLARLGLAVRLIRMAEGGFHPIPERPAAVRMQLLLNARHPRAEGGELLRLLGYFLTGGALPRLDLVKPSQHTGTLRVPLSVRLFTEPVSQEPGQPAQPDRDRGAQFPQPHRDAYQRGRADRVGDNLSPGHDYRSLAFSAPSSDACTVSSYVSGVGTSAAT